MKSLLVTSTASLAAASCSYGTTLFPRDTRAPVATFAYDGLNGPLNWYGLNTTANAACALGTRQSPINIVTENYGAYSGVELDFALADYPEGAEIENLGSTLEVFANGSMTSKCGKQYALKQFHFHTPSEHHINGEYHPMEVHFVFQAADASLSVVGFPIEVVNGFNTSSLWLDRVFTTVDDVAVPGSIGTTGPFTFDSSGLEAILQKALVARYSGSLTTPPCTEGVAWNLVLSPLGISVDTFNKVKSIMKFNSRYIQNVPGGINLLDNIRRELDSQPEPTRA